MKATADDRYLAVMCMEHERIPHYEHWSCPDAETYLSGINYYEQPRSCRLKLKEVYPELHLPIPETDEPIARPGFGKSGAGTGSERHTVRWGDGESWTWEHGEAYFTDPEDVFAFSPLEKPDFTGMPGVIMNFDFSSEEVLYQRFRAEYPAEWGETAPEGSIL